MRTEGQKETQRKCFKTELPPLYRKPGYCDGDGYIQYSEFHVGKYEDRLGEEEAAVWLWYLAARWPKQPALPGWQCPIEWLLSLRNGTDLWGVDKTGELVIVEDKIRGRGPRYDPFDRFLPLNLHDRDFTAEELRRKWNDLTTDGRLPGSSKAILARRWGQLTDATRERLESPRRRYTERVACFLTEREERGKKGNAIPHFAGLILGSDPDDELRSLGQVKKGKELADEVGPDHVHLFIAYAKRVAESKVQCCVKRVEPPWVPPPADGLRLCASSAAELATHVRSAIPAMRTGSKIGR